MSWPQAILDPTTGDVLLNLVRISHPDWAEDLRYVANTEDIVSNGYTFTAAAFEVALPDKVEGKSGPMQFRAADYDNSLYAALRAADGPVGVEVSWVLASDPDTIHVGPYDAEVWEAQHRYGVISGALTAWPVMEEKANARFRFNTVDFPGLR